MSLLLLSLSTIRQAISAAVGSPSLDLIFIIREILYRSDDPTAIQEALHVLKRVCSGSSENRRLLCDREDFLPQLLWILRTKAEQAPQIYAHVLILIIMCENELGKENITSQLVENTGHIMRGLKHEDSWFVVFYTLVYITDEGHHALQVFLTLPAPEELAFIDEMVVWLYNIYLHIAKGKPPVEAVTMGLTLILILLARCASSDSLSEEVAEALAYERVTDSRGIPLFIPALIIQQKGFNNEAKTVAMGLMSRIAAERPLQGWHLRPYFNFFNIIREDDWDLDKYRWRMFMDSVRRSTKRPRRE